MSNESGCGFEGWAESSRWAGQRSRMTDRWDDLSIYITTMERKGTKCPWSYFLIRSVVRGYLSDRRSQYLSDCSSGLCSRYSSTARSWSRTQTWFRQTGNRGRCFPPHLALLHSRVSSIVCANHSNSLTDALWVPWFNVQLH